MERVPRPSRALLRGPLALHQRIGLGGLGPPFLIGALAALVGTAALLGATPAHATTVAISPLLVDASVSPKDRLGVHQILSSELDFAPEVDRVVELDRVPDGLDDWCMTNERCLQGIVSRLQVDGIVAGRMKTVENTLRLDLMYFEGAEIQRRRSYTVPQDPTGLSLGLTTATRELLTGVNPAEVKAATATEADFEVDDDMPLAPSEEDASALRDLDEGEAPPERGTATRAPEPRTARAPARTPDLAPSRVSSDPARPPESRTTRPASPAGAAEPPVLKLSGRGGYSNYYSFDFVTAGGEVALRAARGVYLVGGLEVYNVRRVLPPHLQANEGRYSQWDAIYPFNGGILLQPGAGTIRPYVGADAIGVQYYRDDIGSDWAVGGRGRFGVDFMVARAFGFNVNVAAGAWTGKNWDLIERGARRTGFLPQISAGTLLAL